MTNDTDDDDTEDSFDLDERPVADVLALATDRVEREDVADRLNGYVEALAARGAEREDLLAMPMGEFLDRVEATLGDGDGDRQNADVAPPPGDPSGYGADMFTDGGRRNAATDPLTWLSDGTRSGWEASKPRTEQEAAARRVALRTERSRANAAPAPTPADTCSCGGCDCHGGDGDGQPRANYAAVPGPVDRSVDDGDVPDVSAGTRSSYEARQEGD